MKNFPKILSYSLPFLYFVALFFFYGYGEISLVMMNKIAGLLALSLIGTSFVIGPFSYFVPEIFDQFKTYRKYIGVSGFVVALMHLLLSYISYFSQDFNFMFFSPDNSRLLGVYAGFIALLIFSILVLSSVNKVERYIGGKRWKQIQTTGYLGFAFVMIHFFLIETNNGSFNIRRPLGRYIFVFGFLLLGLRLIVYLVKKFKK